MPVRSANHIGFQVFNIYVELPSKTKKASQCRRIAEFHTFETPRFPSIIYCCLIPWKNCQNPSEPFIFLLKLENQVWTIEAQNTLHRFLRRHNTRKASIKQLRALSSNQGNLQK